MTMMSSAQKIAALVVAMAVLIVLVNGVKKKKTVMPVQQRHRYRDILYFENQEIRTPPNWWKPQQNRNPPPSADVFLDVRPSYEVVQDRISETLQRENVSVPHGFVAKIIGADGGLILLGRDENGEYIRLKYKSDSGLKRLMMNKTDQSGSNNSNANKNWYVQTSYSVSEKEPSEQHNQGFVRPPSYPSFEPSYGPLEEPILRDLLAYKSTTRTKADHIYGRKRKKRDLKNRHNEEDFKMVKVNSRYKPIGMLKEPDRRGKQMNFKNGRDLIYERMAMRSQVFPTRKKEFNHSAGGGIYEKMLLQQSGLDEPLGRENVENPAFDFAVAESREMQCCPEVSLASSGGVNECHPYVLGDYKKIGVCGGRSFFQHKNNTDIFLYYACGAWYVGLEIGTCGGWLMAKSLEICVSSQHLTPWRFFDEGHLQDDDTFILKEHCKAQPDFGLNQLPAARPVANNKTPSNSIHSPALNYPHPQSSMNASPSFPWGEQTNSAAVELTSSKATFQSTSNDKSRVQHEHIHYHINLDDKEDGEKPFSLHHRHPEQQQRRRPPSYGEVRAAPKTRLPPAPPVSSGIRRKSPINRFFGGSSQLSHESDVPRRGNLHHAPHILISNLNVLTATSTTTTTRPTTTTTTTTTTMTTRRTTTSRPTTVRAYAAPPSSYFHPLRYGGPNTRPSSDLQYPKSQPLPIEQNVAYELYNTNYAGTRPSSTFEQQQNSRDQLSGPDTIGYIIRKRKQPTPQSEMEMHEAQETLNNDWYEDVQARTTTEEDRSGLVSVDEARDFYFPRG